jgi:hypothetical protein
MELWSGLDFSVDGGWKGRMVTVTAHELHEDLGIVQRM